MDGAFGRGRVRCVPILKDRERDVVSVLFDAENLDSARESGYFGTYTFNG